ncbi:DUF2142 domain-containing protein [Microbacterium arborescens]|uniref:DUF2142 domain-containing protein n=1 Tax=Microbacterium arborescens TaxID=33883 RepID=UPI0025A19EBD|nr:DUF2142 domain-containing protein [Microbacterium arborescens]WJM15017.1 DUF2142 domain-containing protein [Microbacterium arborescens]
MRARAASRVGLPVVIVVSVLIALLSWAVSSPPGSSPDDDYHMASIWCASGDQALCAPGSDPSVRILPEPVLRAADCFAFDGNKSGACSFDENATGSSARGNWNGGAYPPVYYAVMGIFAGDDLSLSIVAIRLANIVLYLLTMTLLFFLLPRRGRVALVWGAAITAVPLGVFLIASVNPSAWSVISASGLVFAAWGFFDQRGIRKALLGAMAVVLLFIGAGARSDSAVYGGLALVAASVLAFRRDSRYLRDLSLPAALLIAAVVFFFSGGQSAIVGGDTAVDNSTYSFSELLFINVKALPQLLSGGLGTWGLGWLDTYMPGLVWVTTMFILAGVIFWCLRYGTWRKWLALSGVTAAMILVPLYILMHDGVVVGNGVQPRYVYPIIVMFAGIVVFGTSRGALGLNRLQLVLGGVGLAVAHSVALHVNIRRYVTGVDLAGINLDRDVEWWWNTPISPMGIWVWGSLAFAVALGALIWAAAHSNDETPRVEGDLAVPEVAQSSRTPRK